MSINTENFFMVPKELHNTDMNLSEVYLYSRMMDDYEYFDKRYGVYAPSHEALAAYLQSDRAQTAAAIIDKLVTRGLIIDTGSRHGGRKIYVVIDYTQIEGLITKLPIAERRKNKSRLTESVKQTNEKREPNQRKALTSLTQSDDMSDLNHTSTTLKSELINKEEDKEIESNQFPPNQDELESDSSSTVSIPSSPCTDLTVVEPPEEVATVTPNDSTRRVTPQYFTISDDYDLYSLSLEAATYYNQGENEALIINNARRLLAGEEIKLCKGYVTEKVLTYSDSYF